MTCDGAKAGVGPPHLHFVEAAFAVIGVPLLDDVAVGLLRILEYGAVIDAIEIEVDVAAMVELHAELLREPIDRLLVFAVAAPRANIPRVEIHRDAGCSEKRVLVRKSDHIADACRSERWRADDRLKGECAARIERARVVNDALVVIDERGVERRVVPGRAGRPLVERRLRGPDVIRREARGAARRLRFAETHQAFGQQRVPRIRLAQIGELACGAQPVGGDDAKTDDSSRRPPRHRGAINPVAGHEVSVGAAVVHRNGSKRSTGIDAVLQDDIGQAVGIVQTSRHHDCLVRRRQNRRVRYVENRRACVSHGSAVAGAGRAEVCRDGQTAKCFQIITLQTQQEFRRTAQPSRFSPQRGR